MSKPVQTIHIDHGDEGYGAIVGDGAKPMSVLERKLDPKTLASNKRALRGDAGRPGEMDWTERFSDSSVVGKHSWRR
jgi:hypothetical protein